MWWNDLKQIWKLEGWRGSFEDCFKWEVGNGKDILFWEDNWLGYGSLKNRFPRLFSIFVNKEVSLSECGTWDNNVWAWRLNWRKGNFVWEESLARRLIEVLLGLSPALEYEDI